jgi:hypothetical protein
MRFWIRAQNVTLRSMTSALLPANKRNRPVQRDKAVDHSGEQDVLPGF